jgi:hypothetical protein
VSQGDGRFSLVISGVTLKELRAGWVLIFLQPTDGGNGEFGGVEEAECGALFEVVLVGLVECLGDDVLVSNRGAMGLGAGAAEKLGGDLWFSRPGERNGRAFQTVGEVRERSGIR